MVVSVKLIPSCVEKILEFNQFRHVMSQIL